MTNPNQPHPLPGFLRLTQIIGDQSCNPPITGLFPVGKSTWWAGIKKGVYPDPVKISPRCSAWRTEDIQKLISQVSNGKFQIEED